MKRVLAVLLAGLMLCGCFAMLASASAEDDLKKAIDDLMGSIGGGETAKAIQDAIDAFGVDITDKFTDVAFRAKVYELIGKTAPEPIYDTDVAGIEELSVVGFWYESLAGLEYFTGLVKLECIFTGITALPSLPLGLEILDCIGNQLKTLPTLPSGLKELLCSDNPLGRLPALPSGLEELNCYRNQLTALPTLPSTLKGVVCHSNRLISLPTLPSSLEFLMCSYNQIIALPTLPSKLDYLFCENNLLTSLPALPNGLIYLDCSNNRLATLPKLPSSLNGLGCNGNRLTGLDVTGLQLELLWCQNNRIPNKSAIKGFNGTWDGEYFIFDPQNDAPFWTTLSPFLQFILRWFLFGWLWMG